MWDICQNTSQRIPKHVLLLQSATTNLLGVVFIDFTPKNLYFWPFLPILGEGYNLKFRLFIKITYKISIFEISRISKNIALKFNFWNFHDISWFIDPYFYGPWSIILQKGTPNFNNWNFAGSQKAPNTNKLETFCEFHKLLHKNSIFEIIVIHLVSSIHILMGLGQVWFKKCSKLQLLKFCHLSKLTTKISIRAKPS